ncbi:MAG: ParA family protein [Anaerolineae bacterium]|nr:ParA family protein [Anaerolineae bacterium]
MNEKPQVVTVYVSKGGVGKTTLIWMLGLYLAGIGKRVVIVDLDQQGSQSTVFDLVDDTGRGGEVLHEVLYRRLDILAALTFIDESYLPVFPGHQQGALAVVQGGPQTKIAIDDIAAKPMSYRVPSYLDIVREPVAALAGNADFVLMDMGPSDQVAALAGLVATDHLIIPTTMDFLSVERIAPVLIEVEVAQDIKPDLGVLGLIPMMTRSYFGGLRRSRNFQAGERYLRTNYDELLLKGSRGAMIELPYHEAIRQVMWAGVPLFSDEVALTTKADALLVLNAIAARLGVAEVVQHV